MAITVASTSIDEIQISRVASSKLLFRFYSRKLSPDGLFRCSDQIIPVAVRMEDVLEGSNLILCPRTARHTLPAPAAIQRTEFWRPCGSWLKSALKRSGFLTNPRPLLERFSLKRIISNTFHFLPPADRFYGIKNAKYPPGRRKWRRQVFRPFPWNRQDAAKEIIKAKHISCRGSSRNKRKIAYLCSSNRAYCPARLPSLGIAGKTGRPRY